MYADGVNELYDEPIVIAYKEKYNSFGDIVMYEEWSYKGIIINKDGSPKKQEGENNMKEIKINLNKIEDVKKFVNIVSKYNFETTIKSGRYIIDAKSIMGLFSLDLSKPVALVIEADDKAFSPLVKELSDAELLI